MPWSSPRTWATNDLVSATMMNTEVRDNLLWIAGTAGVITQPVLANAVTTNPATTSSTLTPLADPTLAIVTAAGSTVIALAVASISCSTLAAIESFQLEMDAVGGGAGLTNTVKVANAVDVITLVGMWTNVTAASHSIQLYWATNAGTITRSGSAMSILALELRR